MRIKKLWMAPLIGVILGIGLFYRADIVGLAQGQSSTMGAILPGGTTAIAATTTATTTIRVATTGVDQVSASGNIELGSQRSVMLEVTGVISQITVEEGDTVAKGDLLLTLDNIIIVPHIASATKTARDKMAWMAAQNLIAGLKGEHLPNCVNPQVYK